MTGGASDPVARALVVRAEHWTRGIEVDSVLVARRVGPSVSVVDLDKDVAVVLTSGPGPEIALNSSLSIEAMRFGCAHALGHYVAKTDAGIAEFGFIDRRDHLDPLTDDPTERWASVFAAVLTAGW